MAQKNKRNTYFLTALFLGSFFLGVSFAVTPEVQAEDVVVSDEERDDIKDDINKIEDKLAKEEKKKNLLQSDLSHISSTLSATQASIARVSRLVQEAESSIQSKEQEIQNLEQQAILDRHLLRSLLQELYYSNNLPLVEVMLGENDVTKVLETNDNLFSTQEKIQQLIGEMNEAKGQIASEKVSLEERKDDHETLLDVQNKQKQGLVLEKNEVAEDLEDQATVVSKLQSELNELQGDLQVLTGKSYSASNIKEAISFASGKTGVPKGFLYGMLKVETNLGKNVGGCTYAQVESGAEANYKKGKLSKRSYQTFIARRKTFKTITDELDLDYRKQKVSCNPASYAGTGGAMGVAQFMPDTWLGYKARVAAVTGNHPPSPWNLTDGVTAMALKLKQTPGVTNGDTSALKKATCSYLGTCWEGYYKPVLYWAKNYKQLL